MLRIDSHYGGTWDSHVGKTFGKVFRESDRSMYQPEGSLTLLLQLRRKSDVLYPRETRTDIPAETPEVLQDPCQHWRENLRLLPRIHTKSRPRHRPERNHERPLGTRIEAGLA